MNFKFLLLLLLTFCTISQNIVADTRSTGSISGKLQDKESQNALDYVNVILYKNESTTPYKSGESDHAGQFTFSDVAPGTYRLEAKLLGYVTHRENIAITSGKVTDLGAIQMKADAKLLKTVEVSGIRSNMKLEIDKKTYSVDQSIAAAGASASDILKDIPSVEVNAEGTVSLRNSESVTVWINGKPSGLTADNRGQVLQQMPAENIDRIEVVTNPSAKYSPEGSAGIINIILKKNRKSGYYGSLSAGVSNPWGKNLGANINYSSSRLDAYANLGLRGDTHQGDGSSKRRIYNLLSDPIDTSYINSQSSRSFGGEGLFMRAGVDYHLTDKHTLGLSGFAMNGSRNTDSEIAYQYLNNERQLTRKQERNSTGESVHRNYDLSMDYLWEIGENHSLQANLSRGYRNNTSSNSYLQSGYSPQGELLNTSFQQLTGPSTDQDWEFKVDYSKKFSEKWKMEAGMKSEWESKYSDNGIYNGKPQGTGWIIPATPDLANGFDYKEQKHAVYGTLTGKTDSRFGYQLGLRAENTGVSFVSTGLDGVSREVDKQYLDLFPTLFLSYELSKGSDIQLNYSKRINRPRGRMLNPFVDISDSTVIRSGNPDLNPEYAHAFEMNFIKTWQNHTLSSSMYHRITNQVIQDIRYMDQGTMFQNPANVTSSTSSGFEFVSKDRLTKILETTSTINLYYGTMEGYTFRGNDYKGTSGFSWNARLNGTLILPKGITGQITTFYSAPRIIAQGESKGSYSLDLGLRKSFLENKLQLSLNARNILNSFRFDDTTWGPGFYQENTNKFFGRDLRLNLTWNFGNLKPKARPRKEGGNENSMDMGNEY